MRSHATSMIKPKSKTIKMRQKVFVTVADIAITSVAILPAAYACLVLLMQKGNEW